MAGFSIIADIGSAMVDILRQNMVPKLIVNTESIGLCHPSDKGDIVLGINLYNIEENEDIITGGMVSDGLKKMKYPPAYYNLYYMITAYSSSDIKFRSAEEAKLLGKVLQVFRDNAILGPEMLGEAAGNADYKPKIELQKLTTDEKMKLWNVPNVPYKFSLFYKVYPVEVESEKSKPVARVVQAAFDFQENTQQE